MSYIKSWDFPIHFMCYWWLFWLAMSVTDFNEFVMPSGITLLQYILLLMSFFAGYISIKLHDWSLLGNYSIKLAPIKFEEHRIRFFINISAAGCSLLLLASLFLSGAIDYNFDEYFYKMRIGYEGQSSLTGYKYLDILTKILAFPLSYVIVLVILSNEIRDCRVAFVVCILNILCFCYLWQVNYPVIHLFWAYIYYYFLTSQNNKSIKSGSIIVVVGLLLVLVASSANRFGGDVLGGMQRYIFGYHLIGFSFYDSQYNNSQSILHSMSYGRSSLGFLDQILETFFKFVGVIYKAASSENSDYNDQTVEIGRFESREFNAFGTLLFTFYRDFKLIGIVFGGFLAGAVITYFRYCSASSWMSRAFFMLFSSSWMIGMMVSPLEQAYFWFSIVALMFINLLNRGFKFN